MCTGLYGRAGRPAGQPESLVGLGFPGFWSRQRQRQVVRQVCPNIELLTFGFCRAARCGFLQRRRGGAQRILLRVARPIGGCRPLARSACFCDAQRLQAGAHRFTISKGSATRFKLLTGTVTQPAGSGPAMFKMP